MSRGWEDSTNEDTERYVLRSKKNKQGERKRWRGRRSYAQSFYVTHVLQNDVARREESSGGISTRQ